ncbi:MAG TPA: ABC transporter permease [Acidimicrobiales bacterium]|nr:ABC transporter permease [Acidimicrobiales bacterium]
MELGSRLATAGDAPGRPGPTEIRVISPEVKVLRRVADVWRYRELLVGLVRKELRVKYKGSVVGVAWSMLNPALTLAIYYFIFQIVLGAGIPSFAIFLMTGLLAYNLFSYSCMNATSAMVGNAAILKKVAFPREILALASVATGLIFFFFQAVVLVLVLAGARYSHISWAFLPEVVPALLALIVFSAALAVFLSAVNVYFRDTQHLVEIIVGALWFWATPIVYPYGQIAKKLASHHLPAWLPLLNPVTDVVLVFQRAIYGVLAYRSSGQAASLKPGLGAPQQNGLNPLLPAAGEWWYLWHVLVVLAAGAVLLVAAMVMFGRLEGNFAEEL